MPNNKWIKLHSKLLNWEWYKDQNTKDLFIHCLLKANWKDNKFQGMKVPRGSFVTSRRTLSEEINISEQSVRTSLKRLKSTHEITIKATKQFSIITVVNYEKYQEKNQEPNQQLTNSQPTANHNSRIIEYKNNRVCVYKHPTLNDIENFCKENNLKINCEKFYNHYESLNWKNRNGSYITNWEAKVRYWEQGDKEKKKLTKKEEVTYETV